MGRVLGELVYNLIKREDVLKIPEAIFEEHLVLKWSYLAKAGDKANSDVITSNCS